MLYNFEKDCLFYTTFMTTEGLPQPMCNCAFLVSEKCQPVFRLILSLPCTQTNPLYSWYWQWWTPAPAFSLGQICIKTHVAAVDVTIPNLLHQANAAQAGAAEAMNHRKHSCHNCTSQQTSCSKSR